MEQYRMMKEVGSGSYGNVWKAIDERTGEFVAVKKLKRKYHSLNECRNLKEVQSLRKMNHPNIVKLKNLVKEYDNVFFVFEYMECNLHQLIQFRRQYGVVFSENEVRNWCFQILQGLHHMHERGYFHRDLKPENLLVSKDVIKIGDLGMARETDSAPPYTTYVTTRWYRAPEVLLQAEIYGSEVDMWAMGAIVAELMILHPIFPGESSVDQIDKICKVIGSPTVDSWVDAMRLAQKRKWHFPQKAGVNLFELIPSASEDAINLILWLCSWNPSKRPTAAAALQHPFFRSCYYVPPSLPSNENSIPYVLIRRRAELVQQDSTCPCLQCQEKMTNQDLPFNENSIPYVWISSRVELEQQDSTCPCLKCQQKMINQDLTNTGKNYVNPSSMINQGHNKTAYPAEFMSTVNPSCMDSVQRQLKQQNDYFQELNGHTVCSCLQCEIEWTNPIHINDNPSSYAGEMLANRSWINIPSLMDSQQQLKPWTPMW